MKEYQPFPVSPIALIVPLMSTSDFSEHKEAVRKSGQRVKCVLIADDEIGIEWEGGEPGKKYAMLDGRHRERACIELGIKPEYRLFGTKKKDGESPTRFVIDMNLERRHLMTSQKIAAATNSLLHYQKEAEARQKAGVKAEDGTAGRAIDKAAAVAGVSPTSVAIAAAVKEADPAAFKAIEAGTTTVNAAAIAAGVVKPKSKKIAALKEATTEETPLITPTEGAREEAPVTVGFAVIVDEDPLGLDKATPQAPAAAAAQTTLEQTMVSAATPAPKPAATPAPVVVDADDDAKRAAIMIENRGRIIVCGKYFVAAIEDGTILKSSDELAAFSILSSGEMLKVQELVIRQWTVKKALAFIRDEVKRPEVSNLILRALIHSNRFECSVDGWKITIEKDKPAAK